MQEQTGREVGLFFCASETIILYFLLAYHYEAIKIAANEIANNKADI